MLGTTTRNVTVIPVRLDAKHQPIGQERKLRVAAYARVSTAQEEQQSSYKAQVDYYTNYISNHEGWELAGIYADEGITGTNTKKREGFKRMIADAEAGKIDRIITKSVSRFSRYTPDTIEICRKLKLLGVYVIFEENGIDTSNPTSETLLNLMATMSQEESHNISINVGWGIKRSMQNGKVTMSYKNFLGYRKGPDGKPEIDEDQAKIIRYIYEEFTTGKSIRSIATSLTDLEIPTPKGNSEWRISTIRSILSNEKYCGDCLRQKTYTPDYISKVVKKNNGEREQYYIRDSHPAIISKETFAIAQSIFRENTRKGRNKTPNNPLANKLFCGDCHEPFVHRVWNTNHGAKKYDAWTCRNKYGKDISCIIPNIRQEVILDGYLEAFNRYLAQKSQFLALYREEYAKHSSEEATRARIAEIEATEAKIAEDKKLLAALDPTQVVSNEDFIRYDSLYEAYMDQIEKHKNELSAAKIKKIEAEAENARLHRLIETLEECEYPLTEFDEKIWNKTIEKVLIYEDKISYYFLDGCCEDVVRTDKKQKKSA